RTGRAERVREVAAGHDLEVPQAKGQETAMRIAGVGARVRLGERTDGAFHQSVAIGELEESVLNPVAQPRERFRAAGGEPGHHAPKATWASSVNGRSDHHPAGFPPGGHYGAAVCPQRLRG